MSERKGKNGGQRVTVAKAANRIKKKAGLPPFAWFAARLCVHAGVIRRGGYVYTLQKLLTHKSPQMTQRYAHLRDETLKRAAGTADDIFKQVTGNNGDVKSLQTKQAG